MKVLVGLVLLLTTTSVLSVRRVVYRTVPNGQPEPVYLLRQSASGFKAEPLDSDTNFMNALNLIGTQRESEPKEDQTKWGLFNKEPQIITLKPPVKETIIHHHYISYPVTANGGPSPYPTYPPKPYPTYPPYPMPHPHHHNPPNYPYPGYPPYHPNGYPRPQPYPGMYSNMPAQPNWSGWYGGYDETHQGYPDDDDLEVYGRKPRNMAAGGSTMVEAVSDDKTTDSTEEQ